MQLVLQSGRQMVAGPGNRFRLGDGKEACFGLPCPVSIQSTATQPSAPTASERLVTDGEMVFFDVDSGIEMARFKHERRSSRRGGGPACRWQVHRGGEHRRHSGVLGEQISKKPGSQFLLPCPLGGEVGWPRSPQRQARTSGHCSWLCRSSLLGAADSRPTHVPPRRTGE